MHPSLWLVGTLVALSSCTPSVAVVRPLPDAGQAGESDAGTPNHAPLVNAGGDLAARLPLDSVTLRAVALDADGDALRYEWRKVSGGAATLSGETTDTLELSELAVGVYAFNLTVTDDRFASTEDSVQVTVTAANQPPTVGAGADLNLSLPVSTATLTAVAYDPDGAIASWNWSQLSGSPATMAGADTATLALSGLSEGNYLFHVTVADDEGETATDLVAVNVIATSNQAPTVNAGVDQSIRLPSGGVVFDAVASDPDGTIASYQWTKLSGGAAALGSLSGPTLQVSGLAAGAYLFQMRVTDNAGATASDTVGLTVQAANVPPNVTAGVDQALTLPANSVTLNGSANDSDGTVASFAWTQRSGSVAALAGQATTTLSLSGLVQGAYVFRLTVTDGEGASAFDEVQVVVSAANNLAPTVNAGLDVTLQAPTSSVTLTGTASDPNGDAVSFAWTKVTGAAATLTSPSSATTGVSGLTSGTYSFRLTVSDGNGGTAQDTVQVVVLPAAIDAGPGSGIDAGVGTPDFSQVGWSTQNGGTTGGSAGTVVYVNTVAQLQAAASSSTSQTIWITAPLTSSGGAVVSIKSNKTILGQGTSGVLRGIGFSIRGNTSNIIIRNLKMTLNNLATPTSTNSGDLIQIYGIAGPIRNIWIDHCEFYSESPGAQPNSAKYDGLIDPTWDVAFVTISWCSFHDHYKACLVGAATDNFDRRITFHHNQFENVIERTPSYRYGQGHVFNNYFKGVASSGVHIRMGAKVLVQGNVFESADDPVKTSDTGSAFIVGTGSLANQYTACTGSQPTASTPGASLTVPYPYAAAATTTVKTTVLTWAGFGKISP